MTQSGYVYAIQVMRGSGVSDVREEDMRDRVVAEIIDHLIEALQAFKSREDVRL